MSLGIPIQKKNIPYVLLLGMYLVLTVLISMVIASPTAKAAGSGIFCKNGAGFPQVQGAGTPEQYCNSNDRGGLAPTTTRTVCRGGLQEWDPGSGISAEQWCADKGGVLTNENSGSGFVCRQGQEWDPGTNMTPEEFCAGNGGVMPSGSSNNNSNTNTTGCDITSFDSGSKGCKTEVSVIDGSANNGQYTCGNGDKAVKLSFNIGCRGASNTEPVTPLEDMLFAFLRFISAGVGLVVVGSVIVGGIQYTASQGNPQQMQAAIKRIQASVGALLLYAFAYAFINWIVPGGILR